MNMELTLKKQGDSIEEPQPKQIKPDFTERQRKMVDTFKQIQITFVCPPITKHPLKTRYRTNFKKEIETYTDHYIVLSERFQLNEKRLKKKESEVSSKLTSQLSLYAQKIFSQLIETFQYFSQESQDETKRAQRMNMEIIKKFFEVCQDIRAFFLKKQVLDLLQIKTRQLESEAQKIRFCLRDIETYVRDNTEPENTCLQNEERYEQMNEDYIFNEREDS